MFANIWIPPEAKSIKVRNTFLTLRSNRCVLNPMCSEVKVENTKCLSNQLVFTSAIFLLPSGKYNIAMENPAFEDAFPVAKGGFPLPILQPSWHILPRHKYRVLKIQLHLRPKDPGCLQQDLNIYIFKLSSNQHPCYIPLLVGL